MKTTRLFGVILALSLVAPPAADAVPAASPFAQPCAPGTVYDPACDVDHDGDSDIFDVQLTAGHWNRSGVWLSDNGHNHLGQTWTGSNTARLAIQGAFGVPAIAPLVLTNSGSGDGLWITQAGFSGVTISAAGTDGVYVGRAGNPSSQTSTTQDNGFEVAGAGHNGLFVGYADLSGVFVNEAGLDGVLVDLAAGDGFDVDVAGDVGIEAAGGNFAGYFAGNVFIDGNCTGCLLAAFGVNASAQTLAPGDVVALAGLRRSNFDTGPVLLEVVPAQAGKSLVGVVSGRAELTINDDPQPGETGLRLAPREGPAEPGQYVTVAYSGLAQVKASGPIEKGARLTVGAGGRARPLQTRILDGMEVAEGAQPLGIALEALEEDEGLIWALVNVQ